MDDAALHFVSINPRYLTPSESACNQFTYQARELIGILREAKQEIPREIEEMSMYGGGGRGGGGRYGGGRGRGGGGGGFGGRSSGANSYGMGGSRW